MKKKLLVLLLLLLVPLSAAYATTTHYSYVTPTVGGSQNTWGTLLNTIFGSIDSNIWSASGGTTIGLNATTTSAANITLTNPVSSVNNIGMTTTGKHIALPAMNATASPVPGGSIWFINNGSNPYAITAADGSTNVIASLGAGQVASVQALSNSTTNGAWQAYGPFLATTGTLALGTTVTTASPAISGDLTTGLYTAGAALVDVTVSGTKRAEWGTTGETITGNISSTGALLMTGTGAASGTQTGVHSTTGSALSLMTSGNDRLTVASDGGVTVGAATGGSKGLGTVNAAGAGYYVNGTLIGSSLAVQTFSVTGTYTPTAGMRYAIVEMIAGGGGGGGISSSGAQGAGGGGAGGYIRALLTAAQVGASKAVTIGAAGAAGASSGGTGGTGGTTSVGTLLSATGGAGGAATGGGGLGGTATVTTGTTLYALNGQRAADGAVATGFQVSGAGGGSLFGPGGFYNLSTSAFVGGGPGTGSGAGGAGASGGGGTGVAGGAGAAGYVVITEYQ